MNIYLCSIQVEEQPKVAALLEKKTEEKETDIEQ